LRDEITDSVRSLFRRNGHGHEEEETFWALRDVSFEVKKGEVVGIIGRNGAGKSTLLKILSRITEPTEGRAMIHGRVASLLEVGIGFHGELSGRENIYLNGAILGMKKAEIDRKFDEIVAFSEVEKFIDTPVKRYSSGMYVRLAFAVAAHLEPEILIVDEVLAVGDVAFQSKCLGKMNQVSQTGRTVLFVSHTMAAVEQLCPKAIVLQQGKLAFVGSSREAIGYYIPSVSRDGDASASHVIDLVEASGRPSKCRPLLTKLELYTTDDRPLDRGLHIGAPLKARIHFRLEEPVSNLDACLGFNTLLGDRIFTAHSLFEPNRMQGERIGEQVFVCEIPSLTLTPNDYKVKVALNIDDVEVDFVEDAARITITHSDYYGTGRVPWNGRITLKHHWYLQDKETVERPQKQVEAQTGVGS
jgi:lipopolysaccharide transport system ATP-binding protein